MHPSVLHHLYSENTLKMPCVLHPRFSHPLCCCCIVTIFTPSSSLTAPVCRLWPKNLTHRRCFYVCMSGITEGSVSDPALPRHSCVRNGEERNSPTATRGQRHTSNRHSDSFKPLSDSRIGVAAHRSSFLSRGHTDSFRDARSETSQDSEDSDSVFVEQPRVSRSASPRRQLSSNQRHSRGLPSRHGLNGEPRVEEEEGDFDDDDYYDHDHRERRRFFRRCSDSREGDARDRRLSRSESVRWCDGSRRGNRDLARTWSCRDNPDKHVRFRDNAGSLDARRGEDGRVWQMLGQVLRERGVPVRVGGNGAPLQIWPQSSDGSKASCGDSQPHQSRFQRASAARHSFHGDVRERRQPSCRGGSGRERAEGRDCRRFTEFQQADGRDSQERRAGRGQQEGGVNWTTGGHWREAVDERLSLKKEEQVDRQVERRRAPRRSQSLSSSSSSRSRLLSRRRWPHVAAGNF